MRKVKAIVEYDGTDYHGFQVQPSAPTVQGELERALAKVTQERIRVNGSGRTDAGVHASGQVVHFDTAWRHPWTVLQRAWNATLRRDIAIQDLSQVDDTFHARFSATSREYRYSIYTGAVQSPLLARFAHHHPRPLDLTAMTEAARCLVGRHDFAAFGRPPTGENTVRTVYRAVFQRVGDMIYFDIKGDAFLRRMVRLIMGTLLLVGDGRMLPETMRQILHSKRIEHPAAAVSPSGLCLVRVNYAGRQGVRAFHRASDSSKE